MEPQRLHWRLGESETKLTVTPAYAHSEVIVSTGDLEPKASEESRGGLETLITPGSISLIEAEYPEHGFELFKGLTRLRDENDKPKYQGLLIARTPPNRHECNGGTSVYWLVQNLTESPKGASYNVMQPDLVRINDTFASFAEKNPNGVVIFQGLDYVAGGSPTTFDISRKMLGQWADIAAKSQLRVIVPYNRAAFSEAQVNEMRALGKVIKTDDSRLIKAQVLMQAYDINT